MSCHVMSSFVTALSLSFQGVTGFLSLEPIPGRVHPGQFASPPQGPQEQFGVQYLAQGHFDMQLSSAQESRDFDQGPYNQI